MEADRDELRRKLARDMAAAAAEVKDMQSLLDDLVRDAPSGIPLSDGQLRIVQSGRRLRMAFEKYQEAYRRYSDFVVRGIVPKPREPKA